MRRMIKRILVFLCIVLLIGGCVEVTTISFNKIDTVPRKVKKAIQSDVPLQIIQKDEEHRFIVFQSLHDISVHHVAGETTFEIYMYEGEETYKDLQTYVYEWKIENGPETIIVNINDVPSEFNIITEL